MENSFKSMDNKGFSLVELIVTVLVTSLLMLGVLSFVSTSRSAYQVVVTSATLQEEAMTVERVLNEKIQEAKKHGFDDQVSLGGTKKVDVFWVITKDEESTGDSCYFFVFDKDDNKLRYCRADATGDYVDPASSDSVNTKGSTLISNQCYGSRLKYSLIADHVASMVGLPTVERADGTDLVLLKFTYEYMGKDYTNTLTAVTRNMNRSTTPDPDPDPDPSEE